MRGYVSSINLFFINGSARGKYEAYWAEGRKSITSLSILCFLLMLDVLSRLVAKAKGCGVWSCTKHPMGLL